MQIGVVLRKGPLIRIVSSIDRSIDRSKKYQQNSENYLLPDKTTKSDVLGNNRNWCMVFVLTQVECEKFLLGISVKPYRQVNSNILFPNKRMECWQCSTATCWIFHDDLHCQIFMSTWLWLYRMVIINGNTIYSDYSVNLTLINIHLSN